MRINIIKSKYKTTSQMLAVLFLTTGCNLWADGGVVRALPAQHLSKSRAISAVRSALTTSGTPDTLSVAGEAPPLPSSQRPIVTDAVGRGSEINYINNYTLEQVIHIDRVVSYAENSDGSLPPAIISSGNTISQNAKLSIWVAIVAQDPRDTGKLVKIQFNSLNNQILPGSDPALNPAGLTELSIVKPLSAPGTDPKNMSATPLPQILVPSSQLYFGRPSFDPNNTPATALMANGGALPYPPLSGKNNLSFSSFSDLDGTQPLMGQYYMYIYSYLAFDARAPIVMVHGTAAQSDTWLQPVPNNDPIDGVAASVAPFVSPDPSKSGYFDTVGTNDFGVWFYNINLGSKTTPVKGNDGISDSADQLSAQLTAVLQSLGARSCHIVAHSKGGTDVREMLLKDSTKDGHIFALSSSNTREDLESKFKVLSLYTIGTPHLGTPTANLADCIRTAAMYHHVASVSTNSNLNDATVRSYQAALFMHNHGIGPSGNALADQLVGSQVLANLWNNDVTNLLTGSHFYSVLGDADLNHDGRIDNGEGESFADKPYQVSLGNVTKLFTFTYLVTGEVGTIISSVVKINGTPYLILFPQIRSSFNWPNDLITPAWSGRGPGAKILQVPAGLDFLYLYNTSYPIDFSGILSGGNHSLLKHFATAHQIVTQITSDYPIKKDNQL